MSEADEQKAIKQFHELLLDPDPAAMEVAADVLRQAGVSFSRAARESNPRWAMGYEQAGGDAGEFVLGGWPDDRGHTGEFGGTWSPTITKVSWYIVPTTSTQGPTGAKVFRGRPRSGVNNSFEVHVSAWGFGVQASVLERSDTLTSNGPAMGTLDAARRLAVRYAWGVALTLKQLLASDDLQEIVGEYHPSGAFKDMLGDVGFRARFVPVDINPAPKKKRVSKTKRNTKRNPKRTNGQAVSEIASLLHDPDPAVIDMIHDLLEEHDLRFELITQDWRIASGAQEPQGIAGIASLGTGLGVEWFVTKSRQSFHDRWYHEVYFTRNGQTWGDLRDSSPGASEGESLDAAMVEVWRVIRALKERPDATNYSIAKQIWEYPSPFEGEQTAFEGGVPWVYTGQRLPVRIAQNASGRTPNPQMTPEEAKETIVTLMRSKDPDDRVVARDIALDFGMVKEGTIDHIEQKTGFDRTWFVTIDGKTYTFWALDADEPPMREGDPIEYMVAYTDEPHVSKPHMIRAVAFSGPVYHGKLAVWPVSLWERVIDRYWPPDGSKPMQKRNPARSTDDIRTDFNALLQTPEEASLSIAEDLLLENGWTLRDVSQRFFSPASSEITDLEVGVGKFVLDEYTEVRWYVRRRNAFPQYHIEMERNGFTKTMKVGPTIETEEWAANVAAAEAWKVVHWIRAQPDFTNEQIWRMYHQDGWNVPAELVGPTGVTMPEPVENPQRTKGEALKDFREMLKDAGGRPTDGGMTELSVAQDILQENSLTLDDASRKPQQDTLNVAMGEFLLRRSPFVMVRWYVLRLSQQSRVFTPVVELFWGDDWFEDPYPPADTTNPDEAIYRAVEQAWWACKVLVSILDGRTGTGRPFSSLDINEVEHEYRDIIASVPVRGLPTWPKTAPQLISKWGQQPMYYQNNPCSCDEPRENPAWVTKHLADSWVTLEETVPPQWLPKIDRTFAKGKKISGEIPEYGCGAYGCVFPTLDQKVVLKLTTDASEAEFAAKLAKELPVPIVTKYHLAMELPSAKHKGRNVYLLWREAADDVGGIDKTVGPHAEDAIHAQHEAAQAAFSKLADGQDAKRELSTWKTKVGEMKRVPELAWLADGMLTAYDESGIFFGDVHGGNLGLVDGKWKITDPGNIAVVR